MSDPELVRSLQLLAAEFQSAVEPMRQLLSQLEQRWVKFINDNPGFVEGLRQLAEDFRDLPQKQKRLWAEAVQLGWYPTPHTLLAMPSESPDSPETFDTFMVNHLRSDWEALTGEIVQAFPDRVHILECAFALHSEHRYIASIPLFFAQVDGICAEKLGAHLFTEKEQRQGKLDELFRQKPDDILHVLISLLGLETQMSAGIGKSSATKKKLGPNRSGVMHGARRHLDYGTEVNSFKALSLLVFVTLAFGPGGIAAGT